MPNLSTTGDQDSHAQRDNSHVDAGLGAKAIYVSNFLDPWDNTIEEAEGNDIFRACEELDQGGNAVGRGPWTYHSPT